MDAFSTEPNLSYSDAPPVLIAGSSERAVARAKSTVGAFGVRIGNAAPLAEAAARLRQQGSASAVWVELDQVEVSEILDQLIRQLNSDVQARRYGAVVSAPKELIDPLAAMLEDDVELLIAADEAERASALALALARRGNKERYSDVAADRNAERLRQLSDEVGRIAATLARLSAGPSTVPLPVEAAPATDLPPLSADTIAPSSALGGCAARYFAEELFADPAWDMLLDLLQAEISQHRGAGLEPVHSRRRAGDDRASLAQDAGRARAYSIRRADPHDGRRVFVELAPAASRARCAAISPKWRRAGGDLRRLAVAASAWQARRAGG